MNVNDQWMLEKMQQMAASMAVPQTGQSADAAKPEKGDSFKDLMDKAKDQQVEAPKKDSTDKKTETVKDKAPAQKTEGKAVTDMGDPRIRAMDPATQAQIAAGFITPVETESGTLLLRTNAEPTAIVTPLLPNGMPDPSKPITLVNANGEQFEVFLDQENGGHQLFQVMPGGERKELDLFPEQPELDLLDNVNKLDMTVTTVAESDDQDDTDVDGSAVADRPLFKDVKAAPVKVGENFQLDTRQADMDEQLADTIRFAAQQGLRQIEIRLSPENLGSLTVKLTQAADGTLQVVLHAANTRAANLLNQHLDGLNAALQGYDQHSEVRVEVQRGEDSQQAQHQADPNGHNQQSQQQQQQHREEQHDGDFLQKLRLGLYGLDDVT